MLNRWRGIRCSHRIVSRYSLRRLHNWRAWHRQAVFARSLGRQFAVSLSLRQQLASEGYVGLIRRQRIKLNRAFQIFSQKFQATNPTCCAFRCMPRYYFNVHNVQPSTDYEGEELPDDEAAWREATMFAGELFKDIDGRFRPGQEYTLEVTDAARRTLYQIRISAKLR
jgi:hypothetical protein